MRTVTRAVVTEPPKSRGRDLPRLLLVAALVSTVVACGSSSGSGSKKTTGGARSTSTTTAGNPAGSTASAACGRAGAHPVQYASVVVFAFENRTWNDVGLGFGPAMPYLHALGQQCGFFTDWTETNTAQNSLTQYVGQVTGASQPGTVNDCAPSSTCSTDADSIFRQARRAGKQAINYVEGATAGCSADGNAAKHVPGLYLWGADDRAHCDSQVRPLGELDPAALPAFAFVTPTLCNDGHDCANPTVDTWAQAHIQPVLDSPAYRAGKVAVFVWYDEDQPVPNLWITPTAASGPRTVAGAGYAGTLRAWEQMLGLPCLANACGAPDLRAASNS